MKNASFYNDLIHAIEKLYSSVTLRILQGRMNTYHQETQSANFKGDTLDLKAPLFKYIDDISSQQQKTLTDIQTLDYAYFSHPANPPTSAHDVVAPQRVINKENVGDLSRYFNARHNSAEFYPAIAEKLEHSIWEHIHASIRQARLGDAHAAKMHADIANSAYRELAHYVTNETHSELALQIETQLDELLSHK